MQSRPLSHFDLTSICISLDALEKEVNKNPGALLVGEYHTTVYLIEQSKLEKIFDWTDLLRDHIDALTTQHEEDLEALREQCAQDIQEKINEIVEEHLQRPSEEQEK